MKRVIILGLMLALFVAPAETIVYAQPCNPEGIVSALLEPFSEATTVEELQAVNDALTTMLADCGVNDTASSDTGSAPVPTLPEGAIAASNAGQVTQVALFEPLLVVDPSRERYIRGLALSPDGSTIAIALQVGFGAESTVVLWDVLSGTQVGELNEKIEEITSVAYSPDGIGIATGSRDSGVQVWNASTGELFFTLDHPEEVVTVQFSPDSALVAANGPNGTVWVWDLATRGLRIALEEHPGGVRDVAFSPDGQLLASAGRTATGAEDTIVRVWNISDGTLRAGLEGHQANLRAVAFSPDGTILASGGSDDTVRLWDVATGGERAVLEGHEDSVIDLAFSPDGSVLASASADSTIKLWDVATGTELKTLFGHASSVVSVFFSADGSFLASADNAEGTGTVRIWRVQ